jgi:hypothetical protein
MRRRPTSPAVLISLWRSGSESTRRRAPRGFQLTLGARTRRRTCVPAYTLVQTLNRSIIRVTDRGRSQVRLGEVSHSS